MRAVIQRVTKASVSINNNINNISDNIGNIIDNINDSNNINIVGEIDSGLCILLGVGTEDTERDAEWLADKIVNLRIFEDEFGKMNYSLLDVNGSALIISQFTLYGDCRKGRRPSFTGAAPSEKGNKLYEYFSQQVKAQGIKIARGVFQAHMLVKIFNDGPVTFILDSDS